MKRGVVDVAYYAKYFAEAYVPSWTYSNTFDLTQYGCAYKYSVYLPLSEQFYDVRAVNVYCDRKSLAAPIYTLRMATAAYWMPKKRTSGIRCRWLLRHG